MSSSFVKDCSDASAPPSSISQNLSSSTNTAAATAGAGGSNKTVFIIVNNDTQIDQEQLSSLLASHAGNSSEVSVVQMDGGGQGAEYGGHDPTSTLQAAAAVGLLNPGTADHQGYPAIDAGSEGASGYSELPLDAESLHQLESVLSTDEARQLLGSDPLLEMLSPSTATGGQNGGCWRRLSTNAAAAAQDSSATSDSDTNNVDQWEGGSSSSSSTSRRGAKTGGRGRGRAPPKRRSQRQQDKAERDEVTKILAENQRMFQLEREQLLAKAAAAAGGGHVSDTDSSATAASLPGNSGQPINKLNIEVQVEFDHQIEQQATNKDNSEGGNNDNAQGEEGDSDEEDSESEDEEEEDKEVEKEEVVSKPRGGGAPRSRGRPPGRSRGGERGGSRGRGRGRAKAVSGEDSAPTRGRGRGRGVANSEEGTSVGRRTAAKLRGAPPSTRGRGRGRGRGSVSKGKQIPVMPESEEEEELVDITTQQSEGVPTATRVEAANTTAAASAAADDQIDLLEKQLSHLHGESSDDDNDGGETHIAPVRPRTMSHLRDVLTDGSDVPAVPAEAGEVPAVSADSVDAPAAVAEVSPCKKILFLKRGSIGAAKGTAVTAPPKVDEEVAPIQEEKEEEGDKRGDERGEEAESDDEHREGSEDEEEDEEVVAGDDNEEDEDEEEDEEGDGESEGDDDYKPPRDVTNTEDLSLDGSRENTQDGQEEIKPKKKRGRPPKGTKKLTRTSKKDENDSPRKKKKVLKKEKPEKVHIPKKDIIKKIVDKKGNIRYVKRRVVDMSYDREKEEKCEVKQPVKKASNPQDYLKILQMAQKNVESAAAAQAKKKPPPPKVLPDPKNVLKKMRETISESKDASQPKKSESPTKDLTSEKKQEHRKDSTSEDSKTLPAIDQAAATSPQDNNKNQSRNPLLNSALKKPKLFTAALDVPYDTLKTTKSVKKIVGNSSGDNKAALPLSMTREAILSRAKQDEAQSYKDANKLLLNKLESKLGKVSKNAQVAVDLVQQSSKKKTTNSSIKVSSSPKKFSKLQQSQRKQLQQQQSTKYKEEFDDEDEELDDLEEYKPLPPVSELNIRRSKRPPKKKHFGDEMIMFDEKETLSDEEEEEEELGSVKAEEDEEEEIDEDDENHHTLKRRRRKPMNDEQFIVDLEVVDDLAKPDVKEEEQDDEDQSSSDEFVEEDDPERLWCLCQRPHNNMFMICCDQCEDWFHGSCVGITKAMGKQMEEADKEWVCPKCCKKDAASSKSRLNVAEVPGPKPVLEQQVKNDLRVLVCNTRTGERLAGKDAPSLSELPGWLRRHPDFEIVKPTAINTSKSTPKVGNDRRNIESGGSGVKPGRVTINVSKAVAEAGQREGGPSGSQSAPITHSASSGGARKTILLTSVRAPTSNNVTAADVDEQPSRKTKNETPLKLPRQYKKRSRSESENKPETPMASSAPTMHDIRRNVRKALTDSLLKRAEDNRKEFPDMKKEDIEKLVRQIEEELFNFFNNSVNIKYKSRYRSLVFNIRDSKNGGLFRQILTGAATPQKLATMTSDEMASKELAEWRQTQGKKELEAIQKHELDMISLGNTYIMKSHKGEIEIDKDDFIKDKETAPETLNQLPEEEPLVPDPAVTAAVTATSAAHDREPSIDRSKSKHHKSSRDSKDRRRDGDRDRDRHRKHSRDDDRDRKRRYSGSSSSRRDEDSSSSAHKKRHRSDSKDRKREGRDGKDDRRESKDDRRESKDDRRESKDDRRESKDDRRESKDDRRESKDDRRESKDDGREGKDDKRDRKDDRRNTSDSKRDRSDRRRDSSDDRHHRDKRRENSGDKSRRSKHDEVSTSDDVVERRLELSAIEEERDGEPSSTVGPLPGELNYDESKKTLPFPPNLPTHLPPNLPTHLPQDQDDLVPPASPTLPMEDDPSYIPPYSPEAIPPQSPIPARDDTNQYLLSSPQTPPLDASPSSTPPPVGEDGGGEYSPSAPPFSNHKKSKTSDYRPSSYSSKKRLSRSCLSKFDLPQQDEGDRIAIWRGVVQMTDVAKFAATAFEVSGGSVNFTQDVPETIDVVGRITPDIVWRYIADTKKAASKEVLVVRFQPTSEDEKASYISLYSYLSSKKRYGVVGNCDRSSVKDFYIIPLASHQPIPQVLLPLDGPGFEERRPHMLVGVVVRPKPKRICDPYSGTWKDLPDTKLSEESSAMLSELKEASERSFTPPLPSAAAPLTPSALSSSGGAAPYDPEEEEEEESKSSSSSLGKFQLGSLDGKAKDEEQSYTPDMTPTSTPPGPPADPSDNDDDIVEVPLSPSNKAVKRRSNEQIFKSNKKTKKTDLSKEQESMLAELNRQIEQHKRELKTMQLTISSGNEDGTSAGSSGAVDLAGASNNNEENSGHTSDNVESDEVKLDTTKINIPDNLHMILENIKHKEDEIKEKEAEILRRKNEALNSGSGDTDMRMLLPPPHHQRVAVPVNVPPPHNAMAAQQQRPPVSAGSLPPVAVVAGRPVAAVSAQSHLKGGSTPPLGHPGTHPQQMRHPPSMPHPPPSAQHPPFHQQLPHTQTYPHHPQQVQPPIAGGVPVPPYHQHPPGVPPPHHQPPLVPPPSGYDQRGPPPPVARSSYPHPAAMPPSVPPPRSREYPPGAGPVPGGPPPRQRSAPYPDQYGPPRGGRGAPGGGPIRASHEAAEVYRTADQYDRRERYGDDHYGEGGGRYGGPPPPDHYEHDRHRRQSRDFHHHHQQQQQQQPPPPPPHYRGRDGYEDYGRGGEYDEYEGHGDEEMGGQWGRGGPRERRGNWRGGDGWGRGGRGRR